MSAPTLVAPNPSLSGPHFLFGNGTGGQFFPDNPALPGALDPQWTVVQWEMSDYLNPATATISGASYSVTAGGASFATQQTPLGLAYDISDSLTAANAPPTWTLQDIALQDTAFAPVPMDTGVDLSWDFGILSASSPFIGIGTPLITAGLGMTLIYQGTECLFLQAVMTDSRYGSLPFSYQSTDANVVIYNDNIDNISVDFQPTPLHNVMLNVNAMLDNAIANVPALSADTNLSQWQLTSLYAGTEMDGGGGTTESVSIDLQLANIIIDQTQQPAAYSASPGSAIIPQATEAETQTILPAVAIIDALYGQLPTPALAETVATATKGTVYATAEELHNLGYSDPNVWSVLGAELAPDPGSAFSMQFLSDADGTTAGYTNFIEAAYQQDFGFAPSAANLQNLLNDIPGMAALLSGPGHSATVMDVMGGIEGYLLYAGQTSDIGLYAPIASAFMQAHLLG